jgi:hypothetical protein
MLNCTTVAIAFCLLGSSACTLAPYTGSEYPKRASSIEITGFYSAPGKTLSIDACTNPWWFCAGSDSQRVRLATTTTETNAAYTDNHGNNWYEYHTFVSVPARYWSATNDPELPYRAHVRVNAINVLDGSTSELPTCTYDNSPLDCPESAGVDQINSTNPLCAKCNGLPIPGEETLSRTRRGWIPIYAKSP